MKTKYYLISVCLIGAMLCMAGCGKSDREEIEQDLHVIETDTDDATQTDGSVSDAGNIPEHLSYTLQSESNNTKVVVDADVDASGVENMHVYEMTKQDMDEDTLKTFADSFFDSGEYEVVKPYAISSREELLDEQSYLNSLMAGRENYPDVLMGYDITYYLDNYSESQVQDMQEGTLFYEVPALNRTDANGEPLQIKTCRMRGDVNGERWELLCTQDCASYGSGNMSFPDDYYILKAYSLEPMHYQWGDVSLDSKLSNLCNAEDAQNTAEELLVKMGYENMTLLKTSQTYCDDMVDTLDGYSFLFGYSYDDIETVLAGNLSNTYTYCLISYNGETTGKNATNQPYVRVKVCSNGINGFEISLPYYRESEKISDHVECLSFDQVDGIASAYMQELINGDEPLSESNTTNFDYVRLQYVAVQYEDKQCVIAPVWVYYGRASSYISDYCQAMFGVMAIDGTVIELDENIVRTELLEE